MKIYTKTGDAGQTSLFSGERVDKSAPEVCAYGDVDELNAVIGLARAQSKSEEIQRDLDSIQVDLFVVGGDLATRRKPDGSSPRRSVRVAADHSRRLEEMIDRYQGTLPELRNFILPGGTPAGAALHLARTVCRRAERLVASLVSEGKASSEVMIYLNRLSDLLFVLARAENHHQKAPETIWRP